MAYRWGDIPEIHDGFECDNFFKHYYLVDVLMGDNLDSAISLANSEREDRSGKYECVVYEQKELNCPFDNIVYTTDIL